MYTMSIQYVDKSTTNDNNTINKVVHAFQTYSNNFRISNNGEMKL